MPAATPARLARRMAPCASTAYVPVRRMSVNHDMTIMTMDSRAASGPTRLTIVAFGKKCKTAKESRDKATMNALL
jgi:hypothetical protein